MASLEFRFRGISESNQVLPRSMYAVMMMDMVLLSAHIDLTNKGCRSENSKQPPAK